MIGINVSYAMMIALIPDQVPKCQTGVANGILAFELVTGSLFGFGLFNFFFFGDVQDMYGKCYRNRKRQIDERNGTEWNGMELNNPDTCAHICVICVICVFFH